MRLHVAYRRPEPASDGYLASLRRAAFVAVAVVHIVLEYGAHALDRVARQLLLAADE